MMPTIVRHARDTQLWTNDPDQIVRAIDHERGNSATRVDHAFDLAAVVRISRSLVVGIDNPSQEAARVVRVGPATACVRLSPGEPRRVGSDNSIIARFETIG